MKKSSPKIQSAYHHLREITRCRRSLVRQQITASNRIHALADQFFPGFLNGSKSALTPFTDAALTLASTPYVMLTSIPGIPGIGLPTRP